MKDIYKINIKEHIKNLFIYLFKLHCSIGKIPNYRTGAYDKNV